MKTIRFGGLLVILAAVVFTLLPASVFGQANYTIFSSRSDGQMQFPGGNRIVRWPDGTLWTTYSYLSGSATEIVLAYSTDDGLNWTEYWATNYGFDQFGSCLTLGSDYDIHIAWVGQTSNDVNDGWVVRYAEYDESEATMSAVETAFEWEWGTITADDPAGLDIVVDSAGTPSIAVMVYDSYGGTYFKERDGGSWVSTPSVASNYEGSPDGDWHISSTHFVAQTFTPAVDMVVGSASWYGWVTSEGLTYYAGIYDTSAGEPDSVLTSAAQSTDGHGCCANTTNSWNYTEFPDVALEGGTQYAYVVWASSGTPCYWWTDTTSSSYPDGCVWVDSTPAWVQYATHDLLFRIYDESNMDMLSTYNGNPPRSGISMAISDSDEIGVVGASGLGGVRAYFRAGNGTWGAEETVIDTGGATYNSPSLMFSKEGANEIWRLGYGWQATGNGRAYTAYAHRIAGSWNAPTTIRTGTFLDAKSIYYASMAQDHNEGDYYLVSAYNTQYNDPTSSSYIYYDEYFSGVGWAVGGTALRVVDTTYNFNSVSATRRYMPQIGDWNINLAAEAFAAVYTYDTAGWHDGGEMWLHGNGWGVFAPGVITGEPTDITTTSAVFHGTIVYTGGQNPDEIGWQYGHTQTATWTETEAGNFTAGDYDVTVTNIEADEIYYVRFYADNDTGRTYGSWVGFLSSLPGAAGSEPEQPDEPDEPDGGMAPPVPTDAPGGWVTDPDDRDYDTWPIAGVINPFADLVGRSFVWFLLMVFGVGLVGMALCKYTRHLGIVFLALGGLLGLYMGGDYMDWWPMLPYLLVGICLIVIERQYSLSN